MRRVCLLALVPAFAGSGLAREKPVSADDPEVRKFDAALAFFRDRSVQDYAATPPNVPRADGPGRLVGSTLLGVTLAAMAVSVPRDPPALGRSSRSRSTRSANAEGPSN
jgi:hypothetical protein